MVFGHTPHIWLGRTTLFDKGLSVEILIHVCHDVYDRLESFSLVYTQIKGAFSFQFISFPYFPIHSFFLFFFGYHKFIVNILYFHSGVNLSMLLFVWSVPPVFNLSAKYFCCVVIRLSLNRAWTEKILYLCLETAFYLSCIACLLFLKYAVPVFDATRQHVMAHWIFVRMPYFKFW